MNINLKKFIDDHKITDEIHEQLKQEVFKEIIEYLNSEPKYLLDHSNDPPYDCSGRLVKVGEHFIISLYETIGDFLQEYTGTQMPTFSSGCGCFFPTIDHGLAGGDFNDATIFVNYYFNLLKQKYNLDEDERVDYIDEIWELLGDENYKLNKDIITANLHHTYLNYSLNHELWLHDHYYLRERIIKLLEQYDNESEVLLFIYEGSILLHSYSFELICLTNKKNASNYPYSQFFLFHYSLNDAIHKGNSIVLTLKTKIKPHKVELRSLSIINETIQLVSAEELKYSYSICADCGEQIESPKNYNFYEFEDISEERYNEIL